MGVDEGGRFRLRYDAPAEVGELVRAALAEAKDHLFHTVTDTTHSDGDDAQSRHDPYTDPATTPGPRRITWADALVLLATRSLDAAGTAGVPGSGGAGRGTGRAGSARRARYRVQVHLDTNGGWLTAGPRLPRHVLDGLTCDGALTPVWETEGSPVNVGRTHRVVPHRTRVLVLVLDRDRGCRFPGCPTRASDYLEVHHLTHWRDGGATDLDNLACLCTFHHDAHHRGEFTITGNPTSADGLTIETRQGWPIGPPRRLPDDSPARASLGPSPRPRRPRPRLGRAYPAPTGGTLHLHLVDLTPSRATLSSAQPNAPSADAPSAEVPSALRSD